MQLRAYFKQEPLKGITVKRITDYRTWRAEQRVGPATLNAELGILRRILKRARLWARVADDIRPLKEPSTHRAGDHGGGKATASENGCNAAEWETAYLAAILCLNTTARGCELKGLQWCDANLFARTLTIRKSKTAAGERVVPLTDVAISALAKLRRRAEGFGTVEPSHYVFAAFVPKFTFSGKRVTEYNITGFDPTRHVKSWRTAWRTLTKKAGLPSFRFHDLRHCAITQLAENGTSDSTIMAIAGHVSRRMLERYSHVRMEAKRSAMEALASSTKTAVSSLRFLVSGFQLLVRHWKPETGNLKLEGASRGGRHPGDFIGGPGRDRTDDLFHAISHLGLERSDTDKSRAMLRGSVHAGLLAGPCPALFTERHGTRSPETGRDGRVTTQLTTQTRLSSPIV